MLLQGGPRDAAVHVDTYRMLQRHRAVSLPQHAFLVGLCLQTAVNYLSTRNTLDYDQSNMYSSRVVFSAIS